MVNLSGLRANAEQVGTMSDNSVMYAVILFRRRRSISQWFSLQQKANGADKSVNTKGLLTLTHIPNGGRRELERSELNSYLA